MCSERPAQRALALALALAFAAACNGSDGAADPTPVVSAIEPSCGDSAASTPVIVRGSLPVSAVVSLSDPGANELDTRYRAWIGDFELTAVTWTNAGELAALVPSGLPGGLYGLTVEAPSGKRGSKDAAFEVRQGSCPVLSAALVIVEATAAPATIDVGQQVTVSATVRNGGQATASGVAASIVSAPNGFTSPGGPPAPQDIPGGEARTFTWAYKASATGSGVFAVDAEGTAADTQLPVVAQRASTNAVLVNPGSFLTANTVVVPTRANVGQLITVALTVTNHAAAAVLATPAIAVTGPVTAGSAPAALSIPAASAQTFQWTFTGNAPGAASFTASVSATDPGSGDLVTVPTAPAGVSVQTAPALSVTLFSIPPAVELGDFTATLQVTNSGGPDAATVDDVVPDPPSAQAGSTATVVLRSGPTGSPATVIAGQPAVTFTWVFTATGGGTLTLLSTARGRDANTGMPVASAPATSNPASVGMHTLGGTVSGLLGTGLVLANGSESLPVLANGPFTFATPVASGRGYAVTVAAQPTTPSQTCTVTNGSGTMGAANVTDVSVTCATSAFTVGGSVSGLSGSGLVLHNGADSLPIAANGPFTFPTPVASGGSYDVTVSAQPANPSQTCTVTNGAGTMGGANVTTVSVACATTAFTVGGSVSGLAGTGLVLHNGADSLPIGGNGPFTFPTPVASGGSYDVTVSAQPASPSQTCTVTNGSGTVGFANVTNVNVTCTTSAFTVGGTVTGLAGSGLVLRNDGENLSIVSDGAFTFSRAVPSGGSYAVTVGTQPRDPSQICTVTNGSGTVGAGNVTSVSVTCTTRTFTVGGKVGGLAGAGLVLQNGSDLVPVGGNGDYTFPTPVPSGGAYAVTVAAQPSAPTQICTVTNGSGTVGNGDVTNVNVTCTTSAFTVGGTVTGLAGSGLVLRNGGENLPIVSDGAFTFSRTVPSGGGYAVTVAEQPTNPGQTCLVANASGTVGSTDVTDVAVICSTSP